jgi:hypothetical protein
MIAHRPRPVRDTVVAIGRRLRQCYIPGNRNTAVLGIRAARHSGATAAFIRWHPLCGLMHAHNGRIDLQDALSATVGADMVVS